MQFIKVTSPSDPFFTSPIIDKSFPFGVDRMSLNAFSESLASTNTIKRHSLATYKGSKPKISHAVSQMRMR